MTLNLLAVLFEQETWHVIAIGFVIAALALVITNFGKSFRTVLILNVAVLFLTISVLIALFA